MRVAAGDPSNSYIIQKLEGTAAIGGRMPLNQPALPAASITTIRQWITDGAIDDRAPSTNPIRVTSLSPLPNSNLSSSPASVVAMFDRDLDVSTVHSLTFLLEGSNGDGDFSDADQVPITATNITAAGMSATFDLTGMVLADDTYRVRLLGDGASIIMDLDANALDGENIGVFPSGDGVAGGDFEALFSVSSVALSPTLDAIQASVFGPTCSTSLCHSGNGTVLPGVMNLTTADASFASLVGVMSIEQPSLLRVDAFDPDNSYLIHKIEGISDDAHLYYKREHAREWHNLLGRPPIDHDARTAWIKTVADAPATLDQADRLNPGVYALIEKLHTELEPFTDRFTHSRNRKKIQSLLYGSPIFCRK
ncbi:Ig-like domain-containing protein, partial [candidate division KSB1 bacterium]|nr:Ig-like domain-containing protein [candidate division KSB1 bacterium]